MLKIISVFTSVADPGCSDPDLDFLPIPDPGLKKGTGSRNRNIDFYFLEQE